ncbi:unnamed protein product [Parnassius mnemosyne]|uniref:Stathmin n=1 Tax=Parnassius mnemosyne TaxID=213953 RepID=A0AAV1M7C0_9NEOP
MKKKIIVKRLSINFYPEYNSCDEYEEIEFDAYDCGGGSDNVSEEEAASERRWPKSMIEMPTPATPSLEAETIIPEKSSDGARVNLPSQDEETMLPPEILAALGEAKKSEEIFGQKIPTEVSECWGKILIEGLTKEQKENLLTKTLIPENVQLAKAPRLNAEVVSVMNESTKNRDRRLEKMKNQLGCGIAGLAHLT